MALKASWVIPVIGSILILSSILFQFQEVFAAPITVEFTGEISFIFDNFNELSGIFAVGDPISGSYTFDSNALDGFVDPNNPASPDFGIYAIDSIDVSIGPATFSGLGFDSIIIRTDPTFSFHGYEISATLSQQSGPQIDPFLGDPSFFLHLVDLDQSVFSDDSLPLILPPFAVWDAIPSSVLWFSFDLIELSIDITSIGVVQPANSPPTAHSNGPYLSAIGTPATLDSTGSSDPDVGDTLSFGWSTTSSCTFDNASLANPQINFQIW